MESISPIHYFLSYKEILQVVSIGILMPISYNLKKLKAPWFFAIHLIDTCRFIN